MKPSTIPKMILVRTKYHLICFSTNIKKKKNFGFKSDDSDLNSIFVLFQWIRIPGLPPVCNCVLFTIPIVLPFIFSHVYVDAFIIHLYII